MSDVRPADRLRELWAAGRRPELEAFVIEAGPLTGRELAAVLRADQAEQWVAGTPVPVEEYLRRFPAAAADPEIALDLINAEHELRGRHGTPPNPDDFLRRFPDNAGTVRMPAEPKADETPPATRTQVSPPPEHITPHGLPRQFGRYRIDGVLGRGGMGTVYAAHDTRLDRAVALKVPAFALGDWAAADRFVREARIAAGLAHPNLCPVFDVGEVNGVQYLTMPVIAGESLAARLHRDGPMAPAEATALVATIARAIGVAHAAGVVHRDLKPGNILFDAKGNPVVTDFGLARRNGGDQSVTSSGQFVGTPAYAAPEQIAAVDAATPAADVYALGSVLFECLTGQPPFHGPPEDMIRRKLTESPEPPSKLAPGISPQLDVVCLRAMAHSRQDRFASMDEFAATLDTFAAEVPGSARRRRWWPLALAGVLTVLLLTVAVGWRAGWFVPRKVTEVPAVAPAANDPLPVGSRWTGLHSFRPDDAESWEPAGLRITSRSADRFTGEADTLNGKYAWVVEGTIRDGAISWKYVRVIREEMETHSVVHGAYAEGTVSDREIEVRYVDRGDDSRAIIRLKRVE